MRRSASRGLSGQSVQVGAAYQADKQRLMAVVRTAARPYATSGWKVGASGVHRNDLSGHWAHFWFYSSPLNRPLLLQPISGTVCPYLLRTFNRQRTDRPPHANFIGAHSSLEPLERFLTYVGSMPPTGVPVSECPEERSVGDEELLTWLEERSQTICPNSKPSQPTKHCWHGSATPNVSPHRTTFAMALFSPGTFDTPMSTESCNVLAQPVPTRTPNWWQEVLTSATRATARPPTRSNGHTIASSGSYTPPRSTSGHTCRTAPLIGQSVAVPPTIAESSLYALDDRPNPSVRNPNLGEIESQFSHLDGSTFDQLYVEGHLDDGSGFFVCVDDGTGGNVVLNVCIGSHANYLVGDEPEHDEPEYALITSGGQSTDTRTRWVVSLDRAVRGLRFFLTTGELDPGLQWEELIHADFHPPPGDERLRLPRRG